MKFLITGGAGFIGSNLSSRLLDNKKNVIVYDNLSRDGAIFNIKWLFEKYGKHNLTFIKSDIRDYHSLEKWENKSDVVFHLAAQVSVTNSIVNPTEDFETNAMGSLNVLEIARKMKNHPILIYSSTNKVYGNLSKMKMKELEKRYIFSEEKYLKGISEDTPLNLQTPYGCSKGCGDQYFVNYNKIFDIPTIVFRQSCIYGPRQFGIEDQGWVAWFLIGSKLRTDYDLWKWETG
jgi:CDP-paratose 2-epimerase